MSDELIFLIMFAIVLGVIGWKLDKLSSEIEAIKMDIAYFREVITRLDKGK